MFKGLRDFCKSAINKIKSLFCCSSPEPQGNYFQLTPISSAPSPYKPDMQRRVDRAKKQKAKTRVVEIEEEVTYEATTMVGGSAALLEAQKEKQKRGFLPFWRSSEYEKEKGVTVAASIGKHKFTGTIN